MRENDTQQNFVEKLSARIKPGEPVALWGYLYKSLVPRAIVARVIGPYLVRRWGANLGINEEAGLVIGMLLDEREKARLPAIYIRLRGTNPPRDLGSIYATAVAEIYSELGLSDAEWKEPLPAVSGWSPRALPYGQTLPPSGHFPTGKPFTFEQAARAPGGARWVCATCGNDLGAGRFPDRICHIPCAGKECVAARRVSLGPLASSGFEWFPKAVGTDNRMSVAEQLRERYWLPVVRELGAERPVLTPVVLLVTAAGYQILRNPSLVKTAAEEWVVPLLRDWPKYYQDKGFTQGALYLQDSTGRARYTLQWSSPVEAESGRVDPAKVKARTEELQKDCEYFRTLGKIATAIPVFGWIAGGALHKGADECDANMAEIEARHADLWANLHSDDVQSAFHRRVQRERDLVALGKPAPPQIILDASPAQKRRYDRAYEKYLKDVEQWESKNAPPIYPPEEWQQMTIAERAKWTDWVDRYAAAHTAAAKKIDLSRVLSTLKPAKPAIDLSPVLSTLKPASSPALVHAGVPPATVQSSPNAHEVVPGLLPVHFWQGLVA